MNEIEIRRPQIDDVEELNQFFRIVVEDTFAKEGISDCLMIKKVKLKVRGNT